MSALSHTFHLSSPAETAALALRLAPHLQRGDTLLLKGPIGTGKTFFARSLIQHLLNTSEDVPSPTYTIVQTYPAHRFDIWHCDLYRLTAADEIAELGLEDAFETALCLIEWPEILGKTTPRNALRLSFEMAGSSGQRRLVISGDAVRWGDAVEAMRERS